MAADGSANPNIEDSHVNFNDLTTAANYVDELRRFADFLTNTRMVGKIAPEMPGDTSLGTPFGGFDDARAQWMKLQSTTKTMATGLTTLTQKLASLKTGTDAIIKAYQDAEARNATSAQQIDSILDQAPVAPPAGATNPYDAK